MLKKEKQKNAELESNPRQKRHLAKESSFHTSPNSSQTSLQENSFTSEENINPDNVAYSDTWIDQSKSIQKNKENITHRQILGPMSLGRQEAFDIFCQDYKDNKAIKMKKAELKEQYSKAKSLGEQVNKSRIRINQLKSKMEQHRLQCGLQGKLDPDNPDEAEQSLKNEIEKEKNKYKDNFNSLRNLKTEIEHCQHLLEKEKVQLMKAFEEWWAEQVNLVMLQEEQLQQQQEQLQQQQQEQQTQYYHNSVSPGQATSKLSQSSSLLSMQSINSNGPPTKDLPRRLSSTALNTHSAPYSTGQQPLTVARMSSAPVSYQRLKHGNIPLTGDAQVDSDIKAFVQARRNLLQMRSENK
ncbi:kinesin-like protein KIF6 isoform X2 [Octopus bimaculoides]|uniref:kinesin-like protein KIF6 isoform X2 n=1 Tax=Octopus bimaculoides TaxID=37653 RepID=UPI0022E1AF62|nr:kinesin-like protein KIF6 isoform X2 [Octopus bimaculoides]